MTSPDVPWLLAEPAASVQLLAESDGIWLRGPDLAGAILPTGPGVHHRPASGACCPR